MPLKLVPTTPDMTDVLSRVYLDAFAVITASQAMLPVRDAAVQAACAENERNGFKDTNPRVFKLAVIDEGAPPNEPRVPEGELVGSCKWKHEIASEQVYHPMDLSNVPGSNVEARKAFFGLLDGARLRIMAGKDYMHLMYCATDPKHAGRGAARLCMEFGVNMADELGLPAYMDATPAGRPVYERFGFKVVEQEAWDLRPYGIDETYYTCSMMRPAKQ